MHVKLRMVTNDKWWHLKYRILFYFIRFFVFYLDLSKSQNEILPFKRRIVVKKNRDKNHRKEK